MSEININQHYSSNSKVERPKRAVATPPVNIPSYNLCRDSDMNKKLKALNKDIYNESKHEKHKDSKTFWKWFGGFAAVVGAISFFRNRG